MLTELNIRNLAVIESAIVRFEQGFHVLTGETGAGKSILVDALGLIAGGRGSADLVRHGEDKAEIEAMFELKADHPVWSILERLGLSGEPEEALLIRREINAQGKSSARVNGQTVNLGMLREMGECLINIHGQHEHQSLLKTEKHLALLDGFGGGLQEVKASYAADYQTYAGLKREIGRLREETRQALQMADLYRYQVEEIEQAKMKSGEDESLQDERRKLANAEKMFEAVDGAYEQLYGGNKGLERIADSLDKLSDAAKIDPALSALLEQVQTAYYQLEDAAFQLRDYREGIEFNPARLSDIEERLNVLHGLKRKYGPELSDVAAHLQQAKEQLENLEQHDSRLAEMEQRMSALEGKLTATAEALSQARQEQAQRLSRLIERELGDLQMDKTRFEVRFVRLDQPGPEGIDSVEFLIAPNPGEPLKPLSRIASGGEMSRIMLAIKTLFARDEQIPVLVFDEVDTGISGKAAQAVAEKLAALSRHCQVFSITHLPQVASMADAHYLIEKTVSGDRTQTSIQPLADQDRVLELARMFAGSGVTQSAEQHAGELLKAANHVKAAIPRT